MDVNQIRRRGHPKTRQIHMRVDEETLLLLQRVARDRGQSVARVLTDLARQADGRIEDRELREGSPEMRELERIRENLWRIGVNVNQVARYVNREYGSTPQDVTAIVRCVASCEAMLAGVGRLLADMKPRDR